MICTKCNIGEVKHKTLKLCSDCYKARQKKAVADWKKKTGYKPKDIHKWCNLPEDKKKEYTSAQTEARKKKEWLAGKIKKSWYCTWPDKKCLKCLQTKDRSGFGVKLSIAHDNTNAWCKDCVAAKARKRRGKLGPKPPCITKAVTCVCMSERKAEIRYERQKYRQTVKKYLARGEYWGKTCGWKEKVCRVCNEPRSVDLFGVSKDSIDGKGSVCKLCRGVKEKEPLSYKEKRHLANTKKKKRRLAETLATPKWLTKEQKEQIEWVYNHMRDCRAVTGELYEVNHIVPLRGENICGLHVPWNLEVLPRYINSAIGNRFDGGLKT